MKYAYAMAMSRPQYEARLNEYLNGGFGEFYLSKLAEALGWHRSTYVGKWRREADRIILRELSRFFAIQETKSGFDKQKLLQKCLSEVKDKDMKWISYGARYLLKVAKNRKLKLTYRKCRKKG